MAGSLGLPTALARIAARAAGFDREPRFPRENFDDLTAAGVVQLPADRPRCGLVREIELVRAVAARDSSTARILDGHFNAVERLALCGEAELASSELALIAGGDVLVGLWGADPVASEDDPARIIGTAAGGGQRLRGVKIFCSGAGGVARAIVVARDENGARRLAYVDPRVGAEVDRSWFRGSGLRSSESHRVEFLATPVIALLGDPDELTREPWFSRDAVRTAATWAGIADCIFEATILGLASAETDDVRHLVLGEMRVAQAAVDRALDHAASVLRDPSRIHDHGEAAALASECRITIAEACRSISSLAARLCGSRALVGGGPLERARRDLDLFLLQHRLEPRLVELGARSLRGTPTRASASDEALRFERLYVADGDPWEYDSSGYEHDKRASTIAALPARPLRRVLDLGCSNGALTRQLAERCDEVVGADLSARAVALASERDLPANVTVVQMRWLREQLEAGATLLAVSWRGHGDEPMRGDDVHDLLTQELGAWHTLDARRPGYRLDRFDPLD
jgi:alkylation response protein AidB-like acyl-CoA dehydrogenase